MRLPRRWLGSFFALYACGAHPSASPDDVGTGTDAADSFVDDTRADATTSVAPRLIAPLAATVLRTARPTLRWAMGPGDHAQVDLCASRSCDAPTSTFDVDADHMTPPTDLAPGLHYFRVRTQAGRSAVWGFHVARSIRPVDAPGPVLADFDADGLADLVVGASYDDRGSGKVYVYPGAIAGLDARAPVVLATDGSDPAQFGSAVSPAGDVDGDGFGDVVIGALNAHGGTGQIVVYRGSATGVSSAQPVVVQGTARDGLGTAVAAAGDVDGDGYADVIAGAPGADGTRGAASVFRGGPGGIDPTRVTSLTAPGEAGSAFGVAVAGGADVNGDGYADVVVGASGAAGGAGRAYVYLGSATGISQTPVRTLAPAVDMAGAQFGSAVAWVAGLDGDGYADLVVGAMADGAGAGSVTVFAGGPGGIATSAPRVLSGPDGTQGGFGSSVAALGDIDGDGFDDVVVGATCAPFTAPADAYPGCGAGRAYVYAGGAQGIAAAPAVTLAGVSMDDRFGWAVAGVGDTNGDGLPEIAVSANAAMYFQGAVYVYAGVAGGVATTPALSLPGPGGAGSNFGWSVW